MEVFQAVDDPVRRRILELLHERPRPVHELVAVFDISRPAVSRHLRVLRESGLVVDEVSGRERRYRLEQAPLRALDGWLQHLLTPVAAPADAPAPDGRRDLAGVLDALATEVVRTRRERRDDPHPHVSPAASAPGPEPTEESA
ncbi:ArsR/SmtB family transcription factor [Auraticoccus monumenti]|nr:metalloregulator ArsR/SmtB family transcription factor [Auraticoccus monumenti]